MADKPKSGLLQRLGSGFDRYIGGLLGEDLESMTPEERANARRQAIGAMGRSMMDPASASEQYGAVTQARAQQRARGELARRTSAAEALMPQVVGRLFGGSAGRLESLPGGEGGELTSRYRQDPRDALAKLYGSQAGRDAAEMAPELAKLATEGTLGSNVGGSIINRLTGEITTPTKAGSTTLTPAEVRQLGAPPGTIIQRDADGKLSVLPVPRAVGGGAPMGAGGVLSPDRASALGFREGAVVYVDPKTGKPQVLQAGASPGAATAGNERMRTGKTLSRDAALQYAANITGMSVAEIKKKTPVEIEALIVQRGGRVLQGGLARTLSGAPLVGGFAKTIIDAANADLMAPATSGGAGIALTQNPTGPITGADVDVGRMQFPNALYPIDVQAQMIRSILEQAGQVEEYDAKGNKVR